MKLLRSLTFRLALFYAALFGLSVAILGVIHYLVAIRSPLEAVRTDLAGEARYFQAVHARVGLDGLPNRLERRAAGFSPRLAYHVLLDPSGRPVTANLPSWPRVRGEEWIRIEADVASEGDEDEHEALVIDRLLGDGSRLLLGQDVDDLDEIQEDITATLVWLLPAVLLLSIAGGALMGRAIGRRIEGVAAVARAVIAGDLSERVQLRGTGDDFDRLGEMLNLMLERIEQGMDRVRRVSDSVAHELRTPLTRLRASLAELEDAGNEAAIADAVQEAERLEKIFNAVLRIARIEAARSLSARTKADLAAILRDAAELYLPEAESRGQRLVVDAGDELWIEGDRDLLFQAVANLLDNAVKFSPEGGGISVSGKPQGNHIHLVVEDDGPGVAPALRERITERFFRAPEAGGIPGSGLGLSLVAAIAAFHRTPIRFGSAGRGLRVEWDFVRTRPAA